MGVFIAPIFRDATTVVRKVQSYPLGRFLQRFVYTKAERRRKRTPKGVSVIYDQV
jgi:hypothetical protein